MCCCFVGYKNSSFVVVVELVLLESTCLPGDYTVTVSHLEIYQEELHDLLSPHNEAESLTARLSKKRYTTSLALAQAMQKKGIQMTYDPKTNRLGSIF